MSGLSPLHISAALGLTTSLVTSGIYFAASHLTIPSLYGLPPSHATSVFVRLYYRGAQTAVPFAVISSLSTAVAAYLDPRKRLAYTGAALATIATMVWTAGVMMSTNNRLIGLEKDKSAAEKDGGKEVQSLLKTWKWMNMARAGMALVGGLVGLVTLLDA